MPPPAATAARAGPALVFGGRGFVGAGVCRELARRGVPVAALGRGEGPGAGGELGPGVESRGGVDALRPETYSQLLAGARAVVVAVGEAPWSEKMPGGSKEQAIAANGRTNVEVLRAAAEHEVPKVVLVGATMPSWRLIAGYREGKEMAEAEARRVAGSSAVLLLKPGAVTGSRKAGSVSVPLWCILEPARATMRLLRGPCRWLESAAPSLLGGVLRPAVRVEELAAAAADAIEDESLSPGVRVLGPDELVGYKAVKAKA